MSSQSDRERKLWTQFVEARESGKKANRSRTASKPQPPAAEHEAALDDLIFESMKMKETKQ